MLVLAQKTQLAGRGFECESLEVRITLLVGIVESRTPHLVGIEFLDDADSRFVVVVQVEVGRIEFPVLHDNENEVFAMEFAQIRSPFIVIQTEYIRVEPYLSSTEGRTTSLLQDDFVYIVLGEDITHRLTSLDADFAEILFEGNLLDFRIRLVCHLDDFRFAVRIDGEVDNL